MERPTSPLGLVRWIGFAQRRAAEDWVRQRDLSFEQAFALGWLAENPGSMQREIQEITRTSAASVSSLVKGLEARGLVTRRTEPGDDRSKRVSATPQGAALVEGFDVAMAAVDEGILEPLTPAEQESLRELLAKVTARLPPPLRG